MNKSGKNFLIQQAIKQPSKEGVAIAEQIFGPLAGYDAPIAPWEIPAEPTEGVEGEESPEQPPEE